MSFKVLVIPEDPTHNGYILKPLVQALVADAGRPRAAVTVLTNPWLGGYDHALRAVKGELTERYAFWDLWLFMPDADRASPAAMLALDAELAARQVRLLCCPADSLSPRWRFTPVPPTAKPCPAAGRWRASTPDSKKCISIRCWLCMAIRAAPVEGVTG